MADYRPWIPDSAHIDGVVERAATGILQDWSQDWFASYGGVRLNGLLSLRDTDTGGGKNDAPNAGIAIDAPAATRQAFADIALDRKPGKRADTPADRRLLAALGDRLFADLESRVADIFGQPETGVQPAAGPCVRIPVSDAAKRNGFSIGISIDRVAAFRRAAAAQSDRRSEPVTSRVPIAAAAVVDLAANLGAARISLHALADLEIGDVILLDRKAEDGVALHMAGRPEPLLSGHIVDRGQNIELNIAL
ncbi:MAG: FliM/FliN family flagellar motor C-terminal domain-containing protein [Pseudomonadota bacterium]